MGLPRCSGAAVSQYSTAEISSFSEPVDCREHAALRTTRCGRTAKEHRRGYHLGWWWWRWWWCRPLQRSRRHGFHRRQRRKPSSRSSPRSYDRSRPSFHRATPSWRSILWMAGLGASFRRRHSRSWTSNPDLERSSTSEKGHQSARRLTRGFGGGTEGYGLRLAAAVARVRPTLVVSMQLKHEGGARWEACSVQLRGQSRNRLEAGPPMVGLSEGGGHWGRVIGGRHIVWGPCRSVPLEARGSFGRPVLQTPA